MERIGDIEINQDLPFQTRQWNIQRVGWAIMTLLIVAALLGVFGSGPLSSTTAGDNETVAVHYERFIRHTGEGDITIAVAASQAPADEVELRVEASWLDAVQILSISPEPAEFLAGDDSHVYVFTVDEPERPFAVNIRYTPREMGRISGGFTVNDGPSVSFTQWSYP